MVKTEHKKPYFDTTIPSDWEVKPIGNLFKLTSGKVKPAVLFETSQNKNFFPVYGGNGVMGFSSEYNSEGERIIIGRVGEYCGVTRYINEKCWITDNALWSKEFLTEISIKFLSYKLQLEDLSKLRSKGGQPLVSQTPIYLHKIILPKALPEQRAIARLLSTWDEAIAKTQELLVQKELRKKWLMQQLLTGGKRLAINNNEMTGKTGYNGEWKEYRISQLFEMIDRYIEWNDSDLYNLVSIRRRYGGLFFRGDLLGEQIRVKKLKCICAEDFLISKRQVSHGAWAVVPEEFHNAKVSNEYDCLHIKDKNRLSISFWLWFCQLSILKHYAYLDSNGVHVEKLIFDYDQFKKRKVLIPNSLEEQTTIAQVLQAAEKEIQLLKNKIEKLKEQKKGLMQQLLTGKIRI
jgi:type I restriction enzyme, S subunit